MVSRTLHSSTGKTAPAQQQLRKRKEWQIGGGTGLAKREADDTHDFGRSEVLRSAHCVEMLQERRQIGCNQRVGCLSCHVRKNPALSVRRLSANSWCPAEYPE